MTSKTATELPIGATEKIVDGWKGIADFLGRSIRTVQGWEKRLGLPVHRVNELEKVFAYESELERWRSGPLSVFGKGRQSDLALPKRQCSVVTLVGRNREHSALRERLQLAIAGQSQFVFVSGEEGIGKTALVEHFLVGLQDSCHGLDILQARCSAGLANTAAYLPLFSAFEGALECDPQSILSRSLRKLAPTWWSELSAQGRVPSYDSLAGTRFTMEFKALLKDITSQHPLVLFLDDIHWADDSSLALLGHVLGTCPTLPLLVLGTFRTTEVSTTSFLVRLKRDLSAQGQAVDLQLSLITESDIREFLDITFSSNRFPAEFAVMLRHKTDGNPLFLVALLQEMQAQQMLRREADRWELTPSISSLERLMPDSIRSLLELKINRISDIQRRILVTAALYGRTFDAIVIGSSLGMSPADIEEHCEELTHKHHLLLYERERELPNGASTAQYQFVHGIYRDFLTGSLTTTRKAQYSGNLALAISTYYPEPPTAVALKLASLLRVAGDSERALQFVMLAMQRAARVFAHPEAEQLARRAVDLLSVLPNTPERKQQEFAVLNTLGLALMATKGYAERELDTIYQRAQELARQLSDQTQYFRASFGLWIFYIDSGALVRARELASELVEIARDSTDVLMPVEAHYAIGVTDLQLGFVSQAATALELGLTMYVPEQHVSHVLLYLLNPGVVCRCHLARAQWLLGEADRALRTVQQAVELASTLSHYESACYPLLIQADIHNFRGETDRTLHFLNEAIQIAKEHGLATESAWAAMVWGAAIADQGNLEVGITQMRNAIQRYRAKGGAVALTKFLCLLGFLLAKAGECAEGFETVDEAFELMNSSGESYYESELHRLRGELILAESAESARLRDAEECFLRCLHVAESRGLKSLQLRGALSMANLFIRQNRLGHAQAVLSRSFNGFSEGFESRDLAEAKSLLTRLQT